MQLIMREEEKMDFNKFDFRRSRFLKLTEGNFIYEDFDKLQIKCRWCKKVLLEEDQIGENFDLYSEICDCGLKDQERN